MRALQADALMLALWYAVNGDGKSKGERRACRKHLKARRKDLQRTSALPSIRSEAVRSLERACGACGLCSGIR